MTTTNHVPTSTKLVDGPHRVQRKRTKGWRLPPNTVCVSRPSFWGNPFHTGDRAADVAAYKRCISRFPVPHENLATWQEAGGEVAALMVLAGPVRSVLDKYLRGKNLACWCPLDAPCHGDPLLEIANEEVAT